MRTHKKMTKAQIPVIDQIEPLLEIIADVVIEELKGLESPDPKVRERAEEQVYELGMFSVKMMDQFYPIYLRAKSRLEMMKPLIGEAIGQ